MDFSILMEYSGVLIVLIILEGLLAVDNAVVLAVMVRHLEPVQRKKALFYGLLGAFVFRFASLFAISFLIDIWQIQAIGAAYLLFVAGNHIFRKLLIKKNKEGEEGKEKKKQSGFWMTVFKVELADIAFAIDSILAAVALGVTLPEIGGEIGGMNMGHFAVIFTGGLVGVIIMRFAADKFVRILAKRPGLEIAAFFIVGWVGVKLTVLTLSHEALGIISYEFAHGLVWKATFYAVLILIAVLGWFLSPKKELPIER